MKWSEVLSAVSSVASITGMSLFSASLLFEGMSFRQIAWVASITMIVVLVTLGCVVGVVQGALWVGRTYCFGALSFVYWCFAGAVIIVITGMMVMSASYMIEDAASFIVP